MMKFSALNESSLSDDNGDPELATREAQEEEAYSMYHSALRKQYEGDLEEAEETFRDLAEMEFLTQAQPKEEKSAGPLGPALTLKYLVYKNLATICKEKDDWHASVSFYLEALEIDSTDVMMWYNMGKASLKIANFSLARLCFEEGLKCNPNHWPCLDNVISVMYTLNDYANCLYYISLALERECYYLKGLAFKDQIYKEDPSLKSFCESYFKKCDSSIHFAEYDKEEADKMIQECLEMRERKRSFYKPKPLPIIGLGLPIKEYTWKNLGDSLINVYDCIANSDPFVSFSCKIDLSPYLEIKAPLESNSEKTSIQSSLSSLSEAFSNNQTSPSNAEQQNGISSQDPNLNEMEVDDSETETPNVLVLPQADVPTNALSIYNDSTSSARRTKRKRSELAELSDFVSKRRSTRVRNPAVKKPQDNTNYQELLHKFLPSKLIGDGKFDEQDYDSDNFSQDKSSCDHTYGQSAEKEKKDSSDPSNPNNLCATEKQEVSDFITKNQTNGGIIDLLYKFAVVLGAKSNLTWPKAVIDIFSSAFSRLRKHITVPNLFSHRTEVFRIKELAWAFLLNCEFKVDHWYQTTGNSVPFSLKMTAGNSSFTTDKVGNDFHSDMEFLVQLTSRYDVLGEEWLNFSARALWLKAKFHSLEGEIDLAVCCMGRLYDVLSDDDAKLMKIIVQNCNVSNIIAYGNVKQQLESLQRCQSLEEVQRLYEHGDYASVVDLLVLTFNQPRTSRKQSMDGVPERHAQLLLLQNSLMKLERYKECVYWSEMAFNEALQQFMNATKNVEWSETMAQLLSGLDKCAKLDSKNLSELEESKLVRLTQNLILIIVIGMENYDFAGDNAALLVVLPWIILYRLILNEEKREKEKMSKNFSEKESIAETAANSKAISTSFLADFDLSASMPSSLMLLFTAHECLGRRSWCTTCDGLLLLTFIDITMAELQDTSGKAYLYREDLETGLEQCIYCLYGHPNKRSRAKHLQEHNAKQLTLTWERALLVFRYFKPNILPEFDSYRTSTISAELENLFRRISALVSPDEDPTLHVDGYTAYIEGATEKCPDPPFGNKELSIVVRDLYYLLGDYYFKNKEFGKAIRFYLCDICINPDRQDSWAGMALSRSSQLDQKLNSYELRNESTIYRKASAALRCFEHALELDPTTTSLWIEYGSLAYILHSHASRQLKQETFCDEVYDMLKKKKKEMLQVAKRCFRNANHCEDGGEPEEAWLHHYMLGKISEKEGEGPVVFLDHYKKALAYLHEDFARYPQKILYHNPAELSIEALEVYYRVHASCLKFLWKNESSGFDLTIVKVIQECLHAIKKSPFYNFQEKSRSEIVGSSSNAASETEDLVSVKSVETPSKVDHNYYENPKKLSDDVRHNRPSTDSLPESQDLIIIKEILDSLVSVVAERFVDEANEKSDLQNIVSGILDEIHGIEDKQNSSKILVESVAEESVYTTKSSSEQSSPAEIIDSVDKNSSSPLQEPNETDDFIRLLELAKELENKPGISKNQILKIDKEIVKMPKVEESVRKTVKDEEVQQSLSSILNSLEDIKNIDSFSDGEKLEKMEVCTSTMVEEKSSVIKIGNNIIKDSKISSTVLADSGVNNGNATNIDDKSECIQSMEISTSDAGLQPETTCVVVHSNVPENMEVDVDKKQEQIHENVALEKDLHLEKLKKSSKQNEDDDKSMIASTTKDNPQPSQSHKSSAKSDNVVPESQAQPSADDLKRSRSDICRLIPKCLDALREVLQRFPQHYKALYRMAHYYCHSPVNRNLQWAREILLAATPPAKKYPSMSGLFAERKNTNFFNGIWRAPSNEIDRPGSFGAHMYRSVYLLIDVLTQQKDYNMLVNLTLQLHRTPDLGKKYMRDTDRQFLVRKAYAACVNILRDQMNSLLQEEPPPEESRLICCLLEIYRTWMTLVKSSVNVDDSNELLEEAYTMYRMGEVDPHPSVLDQAKNFCQIQLGKTYPERTRREIAMMEEHTLQPLYSVDTSKSGTSSKYMPDITSSHVSASSVPSASTYNPDAWQKELAESLMMPVLPREGKLKSESKPAKVENKIVQETSATTPVDASFNNPSLATSPVAQNLTTSQQMVHVEKPKAENLQACSVAFMPVSPVFPKETVNAPPPVFQPPPLLSCQAFECFDVLTSIMQASGYQVASQMGGVPQTFDAAAAYNLSQQKVQGMQGYPNFPPKMSNVRLGRKRRRGRSRKMEGLNLSKKIHTKPIVSATIANSIAQLKIDPVVTSERKPQPQHEPTQTSPLCLVKPKSNKRIPCYKSNSPTNSKGLDLSKKSSETVTSAPCSVIVSTSDTLKVNLVPEPEKEKVKEKTRAPKTAKKELVADMLPDIYDFTDDSNLSTNLETSRIEKCAKEMLEFMNQKVEDTKLNEEKKEDKSISGECTKEKLPFMNQKVKDANLNKEITADTVASSKCSEEKLKNTNLNSDKTEDTSNKRVVEKLKNASLNDGKTEDIAASDKCTEEKLKNTDLNFEKTENTATSNKCAEEKLKNTNLNSENIEDRSISNKCAEENLKNTKLNKEKKEDVGASDICTEEKLKNTKLNDEKKEDIAPSDICKEENLDFTNRKIDNNLSAEKKEDPSISNKCSENILNLTNQTVKESKRNEKNQEDKLVSEKCPSRMLDLVNQEIEETNSKDKNKENITVYDKCSAENLDTINQKVQVTELKDKKEKDVPVSEKCAIEMLEFMDQKAEDIQLKDEGGVSVSEKITTEMIDYISQEVENTELKDEKKKDTHSSGKCVIDMLDFMNLEVENTKLNYEKKEDMSVSEKCASGILDFMNQKIEDIKSNDEDKEDISVSKAEMDRIFLLLETENDIEKDFYPMFKNEDDINENNLVVNLEENNTTVEVLGNVCSDTSVMNIKSNENRDEPADAILADNINDLSKDSTTEDTLITPKSDETITENSKDKQETALNSFENIKNLGQSIERDDCEKILTEEDGMRSIQDDSTSFSKNNTAREVNEDKENMIKDEEKEMETDEDDDDESSTELIFVKLDDDFSMDDLTDDDIPLKPDDGELNKEVINNEKCETKTNFSKVKDEEIITKNSEDMMTDVKEEEQLSVNNNASNTASDSCTLTKVDNKKEEGNAREKEDKSNIEEDVKEINVPKLEATIAETKGECSKSGNQENNVFNLGNNETKNINYSILKKDCVVVIKLRNDLEIPKEYCSGIGKEKECQDKGNEK